MRQRALVLEHLSEVAHIEIAAAGWTPHVVVSLARLRKRWERRQARERRQDWGDAPRMSLKKATDKDVGRQGDSGSKIGWGEDPTAFTPTP